MEAFGMEIFGNYDVVTYKQANAISVLFEHFKQSQACANSDEITFGYNRFTDYFYIALLNSSLEIVLTPRDEVMWMITDEDGEEHFFDTEGEALDFEYEKTLVD